MMEKREISFSKRKTFIFVATFTAIVFVVINLILPLGGDRVTHASTNTWTFTTPGGYTFDDGEIESSSNNLQLKLNSTTDTFDLANGRLHNNTIIDLASDENNYYVVTSAGLDIINQTSHERIGYMQYSGGFTSVAVANGYLYAGKNTLGIWRWQISSISGSTAVPDIRYSALTSPAITSSNVLKIDAKYINGVTYIAVALSNTANLIKDDLGTPTVLEATTAGWTCQSVALSDSGDLYYNMYSNRTSGSILAKYNAISMGAGWTYSQNSADYGNDYTPAHGPNPTYYGVTDISVSTDTSTARAGDNTLYVSTTDGLNIIQENQATAASGTLKEVNKSANGSNLAAGTAAQGRLATGASNTLDGNTGSYYFPNQTFKQDWLEYDLGTSKTFNKLKQLYWSTSPYSPKDFSVQTSSQGTSSNIASSATMRGTPWQGGVSYQPSKASDDNAGSFFYSSYPASRGPIMLEADYASDQTFGGVDMQYYSDAGYTGKDYLVQTSTTTTSDDVTISKAATSSTTLTTYTASRAIDDNISNQWISNQATNTAPQWLKVDLGSTQDVAGVHWINSSGYSTKDFEVQYSTNDVDWIPAHSQTGVTTNTVRVVFDSTVSARYVRLYVTQSGAPDDANGVRIDEFEAFSSMFETGMTTRVTVTDNSQGAKASTFSPVSAKAIRIYVTATDASNPLIVSEMKIYSSMFDGGTVNTLASRTNNTDLTSDVVFDETIARYLRIMITGYNSGSLVSEVELYNTSLPTLTPETISSVSYDSNNARLYLANNYSPPEDGQMTRLDGVLTADPSVGAVYTDSTSPALASREVSRVKYISDSKLIAGTLSAGVTFIGQRYSTTLPTIRPSSSFSPSPWANWTGFSESATKNGGEIYYQLSNDGGSTWYYWNGDSWAEAGVSDYNTILDINSHIKTFGEGSGDFTWKAFLESNGGQQVVITSITLTYNPDGVDPTTNASVMTASYGGNSISSGSWTNAPLPAFEWTEGVDDDEGLGILGYCMYLGTSATADPQTDKGILGTSQSENSTCPFITASESLTLVLGTTLDSALSDGSTYYLRVRAIDEGENLYTNADISIYSLFTYKFDSTNPSVPAFVSASPSGYTSINSYSFIWPTSGEFAASDPGAPATGSGIVGYNYKSAVQSGDYSAWSDLVVNSPITLSDIAYQEGANVFYLRAIDDAGNNSQAVQVTFYYAGSAPTEPQDLSVAPETSEGNPATQNSFSFNWSEPVSYNGSIKQYYYSINTPPNANNTSIASSTSLSASSFATQQGKNTFYIVAEDEAGNVSYSIYASVDFYCQTEAPGMPVSVGITDSSSRAVSDFRLTVTWSAPVTGGSVARYLAYMSIDGEVYSQIASVASTGIIDSGLSTDVRYYYKIFAQDNAGAMSADPGAGGAVSKQPTGKYITPPTITSQPRVNSGATSAQISWVTNRNSDSFVEYGTSTSYDSSFGVREETTEHNVAITSLTPGTVYHFRVQSLDPGDLIDYSQNSGYSADAVFETTAAPALSNVKFSDITTNSAILSYETNKASTSKVEYGTSTDYGKTIDDTSSGGVTKHTIHLENLEDGTTYQLKVSITDEEGNIVFSPGHAFSTLPLPKIENVRFESLKGEAETTVKMTWNTNVETSGFIEYSSEGGIKKELAMGEYKTLHEFIVNGLEDQKTYSFQAVSRDKFGNETRSGYNTFITPIDTRPPRISDVTIETSNVGVSNEDKAQMVVSWKTDEPATSQVEYSEGIFGDTYNQSTSEDKTTTTSHLVIVSGLKDKTPYHLRVVSSDKGDNTTNSDDATVILGEVQRSILTIILTALESAFGWLGGLVR